MTTTLAQDQTRTTNATVALIYSRISQDDLKLGRGVQRQLEDARHLVQQRGWTIGGEFSDNDISAFSGVDRPGYRNLCAAIATAHDRGGQVVVIVQHQSRLWRNRGERVAGIALLQRHRASVVPINGVPLDFSTSGGRFLSTSRRLRYGRKRSEIGALMDEYASGPRRVSRTARRPTAGFDVMSFAAACRSAWATSRTLRRRRSCARSCNACCTART